MNIKYNFKTDENGSIWTVCSIKLFENIKDLDEDRLFSVVEDELEMEIDKDKRCSVRTPDCAATFL